MTERTKSSCCCLVDGCWWHATYWTYCNFYLLLTEVTNDVIVETEAKLKQIMTAHYFRNYFVVGVTSFNLGCNSILNDEGIYIYGFAKTKCFYLKI